MPSIMWGALVRQADPRHGERHYNYRFSNGRSFYGSENTAENGNYGIGFMGVEQAGHRFMVMQDGLSRGEQVVLWENNRE